MCQRTESLLLFFILWYLQDPMLEDFSGMRGQSKAPFLVFGALVTKLGEVHKHGNGIQGRKGYALWEYSESGRLASFQHKGAGIGQASWMWMLWYVSSVFKEAMGLDRPRENGGKALCTKEGRQKCMEHVKGMASRPIWPESSPTENSVRCSHCLLWGIELSASPCHWQGTDRFSANGESLGFLERGLGMG